MRLKSSVCSFISGGFHSHRPTSRAFFCCFNVICSASLPQKVGDEANQRHGQQASPALSPILDSVGAASKEKTAPSDEEVDSMKKQLEWNLENENVREAVQVFQKLGHANQRARPRILVTYAEMHVVVTRCAEFGDTDLTLKALEIMESQLRFVRRSTYAIVTRALASSSRPELAYTMIHQLFIRAAQSPQREARFFRPDIKMILTTATGAVKSGRLDITRKLFDLMAKHGLKPNLQLYTAVIEGYGRMKSFKMVNGLVRQIEEDGVEPDDLLHSAIMKAYAFCDHLEKAVEHFLSIQSKTVQEYNTLMHLLIVKDQTKQATELYNELLQSKGIQPNAVTRNIMINCLVQEKDFSGAVELLPQKNFEIRDNIIAYTTVIAKLADMKQFSKARDLLGRLEYEIIQTSDPQAMDHLAIAFSALISHLLKAKKLHEGWNVYLQMLDKGIEPILDTYCGIISGLCQTGDEKLLRLAERVFHRMHEKIKHLGLQSREVSEDPEASGADEVEDLSGHSQFFVRPTEWSNRRLVSVYNAMLSGYAHANMMEKSERLFTSMIGNGPSPDPITYSTMITGYKLIGDFDSCKRKYEEMRKAGIKPAVGTMNNFIDACIKERELELAMNILEDMKGASGSLMSPNRVTYRYIIEALCREGDLARSFEYYKQMRAAGFLPTESLLVTMMTAFIRKMEQDDTKLNAGSEHFKSSGLSREDAVVLLNDMREVGVRRQILETLSDSINFVETTS